MLGHARRVTHPRRQRADRVIRKSAEDTFPVSSRVALDDL